MSSSDSVQKRLQKIRPPRVQLTYEVEKGDAIEAKELPFVVGVMGDFSGQPEAPLPRLRERKFINIDLDNLDDVMQGMGVRASFRVPNRLSEDGGEFGVELKFRSMDDFRPESIVNQVEPLRKLVEARSKLADLRNKLAGNEKLEDLLVEVMNSTEQLKQLSSSENEGGEQ